MAVVCCELPLGLTERIDEADTLRLVEAVRVDHEQLHGAVGIGVLYLDLELLAIYARLQLDLALHVGVVVLGRSRHADLDLALVAVAVRASVGDLGADAPAFVAAVEAQFREGLIQYGTLLTHDEDEIVAALSFYLADFAAGYLALLGVELPGTLDPVPLVAFYLDLAMALCGGDYETEVEATVVEVGDQLDERDMHASADGRRARRHRP